MRNLHFQILLFILLNYYSEAKIKNSILYQLPGSQNITLDYLYTSNQPGTLQILDFRSKAILKQITFVQSAFQYQHIQFDFSDSEYKTKSFYLSLDGNLTSLTILPGYIYNQSKIYSDGAAYFYYQNSQFNLVQQNQIKTFLNQTNRPQYHVSQIQGWINDPNGLSQFKGYYHMFQQYNPYSTTWGNMHWGHTISKDLVFWKFFPIALYPEKVNNPQYTGGAFSGSAINIQNKNDALYLLFTNHYELRDVPSSKLETQNISYSLDGIQFSPPLTVLKNTLPDSTKDFRDPKIWYDSQEKTYFTVIGNNYKGKGSVLLYKTQDLATFEFVSCLYQETVIPSSMIECPNLFQLEDKWVLIFSLMIENSRSTHITYSRTGEFDRKTYTFNPLTPHQYLDFTLDFYATQIFQAEDQRIIAITWMQNWGQEQSRLGNNNYSGIMTLPRELSLDPSSLLVLQNPVTETKKLRKNLFYNFTGKFQTNLILDIPELSEIVIVFPKAVYQNNSFSYGLADYLDDTGIFLNQQSGVKPTLQLLDLTGIPAISFKSDNVASLSPGDSLTVQIFLDRSAIEVYANQGQTTGSYRWDSSLKQQKYYFTLDYSGSIDSPDIDLKIYELQSCY